MISHFQMLVVHFLLIVFTGLSCGKTFQDDLTLTREQKLSLDKVSLTNLFKIREWDHIYKLCKTYIVQGVGNFYCTFTSRVHERRHLPYTMAERFVYKNFIKGIDTQWFIHKIKKKMSVLARNYNAQNARTLLIEVMIGRVYFLRLIIYFFTSTLWLKFPFRI